MCSYFRCVLTAQIFHTKIINFELKKSLSTLELSDLVRIIEMQEKDIKLVDMSYDERLELLLSTLVQERENKLINRLIKMHILSILLQVLNHLIMIQGRLKKYTYKSCFNGIYWKCNQSYYYRSYRCR